MEGLIIALALLGSTQPLQATEGSWLSFPPANWYRNDAPIDENCVFEVVASKEDAAVAGYLSEKAFVELKEPIAQYYTGKYMKCAVGLTPYMVRAVYGHGGTGGYEVSKLGTALVVAHNSLGRTSPANKSALVVCLDFKPSELFTTRSIAE